MGLWGGIEGTLGMRTEWVLSGVPRGGRLCGVQGDVSLGRRCWTSVLGEGALGICSGVKLTVSLGISSGGGRRRGTVGKKLICTIISQKDKASVHVGRGKLPTGSSLDKHREEEGGSAPLQRGSLYLTLH